METFCYVPTTLRGPLLVNDNIKFSYQVELERHFEVWIVCVFLRPRQLWRMIRLHSSLQCDDQLSSLPTHQSESKDNISQLARSEIMTQQNQSEKRKMSN